ncbi:hypothetical protein CK203_053087 [Vitis vinifera]|uniref:Uncharacterized protein n=1 Tax=Vitis vinifera TaxID=29760 RepID=A0A438CUX9_VITVI|nr:hypothetical protein CK203_105615 [Vitis vinifera]RVW72931.1 hypothetical protein CK203_053087 [Vitis vinifera]
MMHYKAMTFEFEPCLLFHEFVPPEGAAIARNVGNARNGLAQGWLV